MIHKTIKATTTATDQGVFSALAATYAIDRVNDQIVPGAFEKTISAWRSSGKNLPVHWDHSGEASNVIGAINPATMEETKDGLYVEGKLDLEDSEVAKEAWRSMKNNAVSLSFGYLAVSESKRSDGVNELTELDLFEVSIVPAPANADTRFLSLKNANGLSEEELRRRTFDNDLSRALDGEVKSTSSEPVQVIVQEDEKVKAELKAVQEELETTKAELERLKTLPPEKELRHSSFDAARELALGSVESTNGEPVVSEEEVERAKAMLLWAKDHPDFKPADLLELEKMKAELERLKALPPENDLRRQSSEVAREIAMGEAVSTDEEPVVSEEEVQQAKSLLLWLKDHPDLEDVIPLLEKTVWTTAYINDLPDDHFLYPEEGKRVYPVKDADGNVDLPHLKSALSQIPQSEFSRKAKKLLTDNAQRILDDTLRALNPPEVQGEADPLRAKTFDVALEIANDGMKVPKHVEPELEEETPELDPVELRRRSFEVALEAVMGD